MTPHAVRLWLVRADVSADHLARLESVLDDTERARVAALVHAPDRHRFIVAHGAQRFIVGYELGAPPEGLRWTLGRYGKPELCGSWTGLRVNLSHSGDLSAVALCATRPVGVDIQHMVPGLDTIGLATRFFPPAEARFVGAAPDVGERARRFARLWARKEAVIKAGGGRLTQGLRVPVRGGRAMLVDYEHGSPPGTYRVCDVPVPRGFRAAVALAGDAPYAVETLWWTSGDDDSRAATVSMAATDR